MPISALAIIYVYGPNWTNGKMLPVSDVVATWAVSQAGAFSGIARVTDVHRLGYTDLMGKWIFYDHPTQGIWAGEIMDEPNDIGNGTIEISANSMHVRLMDVDAPVLFRTVTAYAGAIFRRALGMAQTTDPLPFRSIQCDESGPAVEFDFRGDSLYQVATTLADATGQEFDVTVDAERQIDVIWRERVGEDKRDRVLIAEGYHLVGGRIDRSRTTITNDIIGIAADQDYERSVQARLEDQASIDRYGRRQSTRRYEQVTTVAGIKTKVRADLQAEKDGIYLPTIQLPALHPMCLDIRQGDTVRLWSHGKNRELDYRILSRTVRNGTLLEVAGIATEVRVPSVGGV